MSFTDSCQAVIKGKEIKKCRKSGHARINGVYKFNAVCKEYAIFHDPTYTKCIFPFKYNGKTYKGCTETSNICATSVDSKQNLLTSAKCTKACKKCMSI